MSLAKSILTLCRLCSPFCSHKENKCIFIRLLSYVNSVACTFCSRIKAVELQLRIPLEMYQCKDSGQRGKINSIYHFRWRKRLNIPNQNGQAAYLPVLAVAVGHRVTTGWWGHPLTFLVRTVPQHWSWGRSQGQGEVNQGPGTWGWFMAAMWALLQNPFPLKQFQSKRWVCFFACKAYIRCDLISRGSVIMYSWVWL